MQGYIIKAHKVRDEDLVVSIITDTNLEVLYRFYGARHSSINLGYKIDFEIERSTKSDISRLRDVIHLGFSWMLDKRRLSIWQQFSKLFYPHLQNSDELDSFYFHLLDEAALAFEKQNPKRVVIESYVKLLMFEGRLHNEFVCFYCDTVISSQKISLLRALLPAHPSCSHSYSFDFKAIESLFDKYSSLYLSDEEVDKLYQIVLEGL